MRVSRRKRVKEEKKKEKVLAMYNRLAALCEPRAPSGEPEPEDHRHDCWACGGSWGCRCTYILIEPLCDDCRTRRGAKQRA